MTHNYSFTPGMHQIHPPRLLPLLQSECHVPENSLEIEHNPFCSSLVPVSTSDSFHHFPFLPVELQVKIFRYAFHDAIRTNCSIYQVQHVDCGNDVKPLKSYAVHSLVIPCGDHWPPREHPLALRNVNYLSRQIALEETHKKFALLDKYIELCDPNNDREKQTEWALPFLEVATSERVQSLSEETEGQYLARQPQIQWLDENWMGHLLSSHIVRCRQVVWTRAWDEEELQQRYLLTLERWRQEAENGPQGPIQGPSLSPGWCLGYFRRGFARYGVVRGH